MQRIVLPPKRNLVTATVRNITESAVMLETEAGEPIVLPRSMLPQGIEEGGRLNVQALIPEDAEMNYTRFAQGLLMEIMN